MLDMRVRATRDVRANLKVSPVKDMVFLKEVPLCKEVFFYGRWLYTLKKKMTAVDSNRRLTMDYSSFITVIGLVSRTWVMEKFHWELTLIWRREMQGTIVPFFCLHCTRMSWQASIFFKVSRILALWRTSKNKDLGAELMSDAFACLRMKLISIRGWAVYNKHISLSFSFSFQRESAASVGSIGVCIVFLSHNPWIRFKRIHQGQQYKESLKRASHVKMCGECQVKVVVQRVEPGIALTSPSKYVYISMATKLLHHIKTSNV